VSPGIGNLTGGTTSNASRSNTRLDDATSLTSFNPFSEEDEHDQSSYALVSSLFSRVKNTFASPLGSSATAASANQFNLVGKENGTLESPRRYISQTNTSNLTSRSGTDRPITLSKFSAAPAPPLVSVMAVTSEAPSFNNDLEGPPSRGYVYSQVTDAPDGGNYGTVIPGFPIQDSDARSIRTTISLKRTGSVSKKIRRIRGEGADFLTYFQGINSLAGIHSRAFP
jgi:1-phosphatidylinositol-3-phosphate 5-kinase